MLRNPYSAAGIVRARRNCARQSSVWGARQSRYRTPSRRFRVGCGGDPAHGVRPTPTRSTLRDNCRPPKSCASASAWWSVARAALGLRRGPAGWPVAPALRGSGQAYRPVNAAFCRLFSCPHRSRAAPFFRRLHALAVQDRGTRLRMPPVGLAQLFAQRVMDPLPSAIQPPVAIVGVDRAPGRKVMRQVAPLAARPQHVPERIHDLPPCVFGRPTAGFDRWHQGLEHGPFFVAHIRRVASPLAHAPILPAF